MRPGRAADHSPPSSAAVMEEYSYTSTHPLGHIGPVTGSLYLYLLDVSHLRRSELRGPNHLLVQSVTQKTADSLLINGVCLEDFTGVKCN